MCSLLVKVFDFGVILTSYDGSSKYFGIRDRLSLNQCIKRLIKEVPYDIVHIIKLDTSDTLPELMADIKDNVKSILDTVAKLKVTVVRHSMTIFDVYTELNRIPTDIYNKIVEIEWSEND